MLQLREGARGAREREQGEQGGDLPNAGESSAVWCKKTKWGEDRLRQHHHNHLRRHKMLKHNELTFNPCLPLAMYETRKWTISSTKKTRSQKPISVQKTWLQFYLQPLCIALYSMSAGWNNKTLSIQEKCIECLVHFSSVHCRLLNSALVHW